MPLANLTQNVIGLFLQPEGEIVPCPFPPDQKLAALEAVLFASVAHGEISIFSDVYGTAVFTHDFGFAAVPCRHSESLSGFVFGLGLPLCLRRLASQEGGPDKVFEADFGLLIHSFRARSA
jgi:hypothetical protein